MSRQQRQLDELRELCRSGAVAHAIDLAFEHFSRFGRDDAMVRLLADAVETMATPGHTSRRLDELRTSYP